MITFAFIIIVGLFSIYVLSPLFSRSFRNKRWDIESSEVENLLLRKQQILAAVSDLEYDMQMKKMNQKDYQQIKEKLMREGASILQALDRAHRPAPGTVLRAKGKRSKNKKAVA